MQGGKLESAIQEFRGQMVLAGSRMVTVRTKSCGWIQGGQVLMMTWVWEMRKEVLSRKAPRCHVNN